MRQYELMVILDPELDDRTVAPSLDKFLTVVTKDKGTVDNVDIWGRRRLAYEQPCAAIDRGLGGSRRPATWVCIRTCRDAASKRVASSRMRHAQRDGAHDRDTQTPRATRNSLARESGRRDDPG
jgi:hypothetical protein